MRDPVPARRLASALLVGGLLAAAGAAEAQEWRTATSSRQRAGEDRLAVEVEYAAGNLSVRPGEGDLLYRMRMRYDAEKFTPIAEFDAERRSVRLGLDGRSRDLNVDGDDMGSADLSLSPSVPTDLRLEFGAGEAELDLGGLALRSVHLSTGASDSRVRWDRPNRVEAERVEISAGAARLEASGLGNARAREYRFKGGVGQLILGFEGRWERDAEATVELGMGALTLRLPRGLGVRIDQDSFLTSFDAPGMEKRGGSYYSRDWESAEHRLTIDVDAAIGSVEVEWID